MQLHELKPSTQRKERKRVGRGGKRGTYAGKGMKGQKSRSGSGMRADFRGGDTPLWKLFPKQRGAKKKVKVKHRLFQVRQDKPVVLNLDILNERFKEGDKVSLETLLKKGLIDNIKNEVKILGNGKIEKKLHFDGLIYSMTALKKIQESGSDIINAR
jgi:large subunit ribosomal protein L15